MKRILADWPGKSPLEAGGFPHPAVYHMLDVAAVAELLIQRHVFDLPELEAIILSTALHDLGKINAAFKAMLLDGRAQNAGRHWEVTEYLLQQHDDRLGYLGADSFCRKAIYAAVAGHHGQPPAKTGDCVVKMRRAAGPQAIEDAGMVIGSFRGLWPLGNLEHLRDEEVVSLGWWLPGFITTADWIGSNADWFPPCPPDLSLEDYLKRARGLAIKAVELAGLEVAEPATVLHRPRSPRPMQLAVETVAIPDGPVLALVEDGTGSGKTEAALLLAQRLMIAGKGTGIYFALPTMATSDAMFARVRDNVSSLFQTPPTLTLAHGRAALSKDYRSLRVGRDFSEDCPGPTAWLADSRRRALLAQVGVGTIDQALLAVLKARHFPLRLYALSSQIVIVDEVHEAGDPYMAELLVTLLQAHRMNGGSAILLTATLPLEQRKMLLAAWGAKSTHDAPYPSLTLAGCAPEPVKSMPDTRGPVVVKRLPNSEDAMSVLLKAVGQGAACVWIRNAVDDAIAGVQALNAEGIDADLLHARFALTDRLVHQATAMQRFSKSGADREGRVLVATQIVEASLDLDFDVMVSDLAPIESLIQRSGRLWRHMDIRPPKVRPVAAPILHVVSPDPSVVTTSRWLSETLDSGAYTYSVDVQWRTAKAAFNAGRIETPGNLRALIEAVHGQDAPEVPPAIQAAETQRQGEGYAVQNHARGNCIDLVAGYRSAGGLGDDQHFPTRLGVDQTVLVLARYVDGVLVPYAEDEGRSVNELWMLSEISIGTHRLRGLDMPDQNDPAVVAAKAEWPAWKREACLLCLLGAEGNVLEGLRYSEKWGLTVAAPRPRG